MKRFAFIINPASGQGRKAAALGKKLKEIKLKREDIQFYFTDGEEDATVLADHIAKQANNKGNSVCIFACGGDGTIQEVVSGIVSHDNATLGIIPCGSGNDFVRSLGNAQDFLKVENSLLPEDEISNHTKEVDILSYSFYCMEKKQQKYAVNGINIGFDGNSAILAQSIKKVPFVKGSASYLLSVFFNVIRMKGTKVKVIADGNEVYNGSALMCTATNGRFCGGGVESCPNANLQDGKIELLVINPISRRLLIKLFPKFKKGKLLEIDGIHNLITSLKAEEVEIIPLDGKMKFVADGETMETGKITIKVLHKSIKILIPSVQN